MKTKVKRLTILHPEVWKIYTVGEEYNGLLLDTICDNSIEDERGVAIVFQGFTIEMELIFEVIDAPIEVEYCKDEEP